MLHRHGRMSRAMCAGLQQRLFNSSRLLSSSDDSTNNTVTQPQENQYHWSDEWKELGLGAKLVNEPTFPANLFFVQLGFGVDQHGTDDATKAAIRAVRNAIEFNSIPGVISHLPGGRSEMLIHVKLGVPPISNDSNPTATEALPIDTLQVAKVFPYGKILPLEIVPGGLAFHTGRVVEELGDANDVGICVAACVSLGYGNPNENQEQSTTTTTTTTLHTTYNTKDGY